MIENILQDLFYLTRTSSYYMLKILSLQHPKSFIHRPDEMLCEDHGEILQSKSNYVG